MALKRGIACEEGCSFSYKIPLPAAGRQEVRGKGMGSNHRTPE